MYKPRRILGLLASSVALSVIAVVDACLFVGAQVLHHAFSLKWHEPLMPARPAPQDTKSVVLFTQARAFILRLMQRTRRDSEPMWRMSPSV